MADSIIKCQKCATISHWYFYHRPKIHTTVNSSSPKFILRNLPTELSTGWLTARHVHALSLQTMQSNKFSISSTEFPAVAVFSGGSLRYISNTSLLLALYWRVPTRAFCGADVKPSTTAISILVSPTDFSKRSCFSSAAPGIFSMKTFQRNYYLKLRFIQKYQNCPKTSCIKRYMKKAS